METKELKFILKLLGCPNYRTGLSSSTFDSFKGEKNKICRDLGELEYVDYSREIATVKILPPGQALLKLDSAQLPIDDKELKVLEKTGKSSGKIAPSEIKVSSLKSDERDAILKTLSERGLIAAEIKMKRVKAEVWLTERGIEVLRDEYNPHKGANPVISLELLGNYLRFLRKNLRVKSEQVSTLVSDNMESHSDINGNISDEEILETIKKLDRELGTENYLPIFHLRQKLQPPLLRDDLDQALYRLQKSDKIDFSTLQESSAYTPEQIDAGIPQNIGGQLFFIIVN
ncbi:MAG: transcription factor RcaD [Dolichospermum sp. UKL201]|jgi:Holliday junction resolvase|uniref:Transcription factor RcaD n=1 Tax=Aphanizomenon flos-aquae FACHB-1040 TaxID=2692887 RepID=A0ABR8BU00_APHFL|nr:transcription factor RcaD [Aphanizomenon flos-aquae]MBD2277132.1 transcription factor RcaD [Aphanizomenon flos-aquae FACHB-1040]QSV54833.1 MAG: transcription factor RcaD [Dolichospermum sp. UKL201]